MNVLTSEKVILHKYQGAGNDFLIVDNREGEFKVVDGFLVRGGWKKEIKVLCDRRYGIGADGLMLLERGNSLRGTDFGMTYFNSDGSGGMMCGNGGRCIVAFARDCGLESFQFEAADGFHSASICGGPFGNYTIRLKMKDVNQVISYDSLEGVTGPSKGWFLDTGTRHYVLFVEDVRKEDVFSRGRAIRYGAKSFLPIGVNVNFVSPEDGTLWVRTYEKGVEDETLACGTGITASCIAAFRQGIPASFREELPDSSTRARYDVRAVNDCLSVDFIASDSGLSFTDVHLVGPAVRVADIIVD